MTAVEGPSEWLGGREAKIMRLANGGLLRSGLLEAGHMSNFGWRQVTWSGQRRRQALAWILMEAAMCVPAALLCTGASAPFIPPRSLSASRSECLVHVLAHYFTARKCS